VSDVNRANERPENNVISRGVAGLHEQRPQKEWLISSDESGVGGKIFYGFGSLWMPWQRRGTFKEEFQKIRHEAQVPDAFEIKWNNLDGAVRVTAAQRLIEWFFKRPWLMFHCLVVRKADVDKTAHGGDYDLARRKHLVMLLTDKMRACAKAHKGYDNHFRVWIDPIASRYAKADEAASVIGGHILSNVPGAKLDSIITHDSKTTPSIQLCDLLLGAVMEAWQNNTQRTEKKTIAAWLAKHLGWQDLCADTRPEERKFNIWYFWGKRSEPRPVETRPTKLLYPLPPRRLPR
jgi:hypothetical protein